MTTDSAGKSRLIGKTSPAKTKPAPLISNKLLLFMVAMVLANTGGSMYGPLPPLYLKELNASVVQIRLFFTLVPVYLQEFGGMSIQQIGWLESFYGIFMILSTMPAGWLADKKGDWVSPRSTFSLTAWLGLLSIFPVWLKISTA